MKRSPLKRKTSLIRCKSTLRRSRSTGKPTKAQSERMGRVKRMGCIACRLNSERFEYSVCPGWPYADAHHLLSGGMRRGHDAVIPLCPWHHRSMKPVESLTLDQCLERFGPTLERQKAFRNYYGSDDELLALTDLRDMETAND